MWDVEPEEDEEIRASAERIVEYTVEQGEPGYIILLHVFHESNRETLDAVPEIIARLRADGYRFVTVDELRRLDTSMP